jgi:phage terminase small subunit
MRKIGDIPRYEVTEEQLVQFGERLIEWLTVKDDAGNQTDNYLYDEFCHEHNLYDDDIDYFINQNRKFYDLMKRAEEIQRTKIEGFAAAGIINPGIAKKLLSKRKKIILRDSKNVKKPKELTKKQIAFCEEYIKDHNGKKAAIRAGYARKNAEVAASKQLRIVKVKNYISDLEEEALARGEITKNRILRERSFIAFSDMRDYIDENNQVVSIKELPREKVAAIKKVKNTTTKLFSDGENIGEKTVTEIELLDKQRALSDLDKHSGLYEEKINIASRENSDAITWIETSNYGTEQETDNSKG